MGIRLVWRVLRHWTEKRAERTGLTADWVVEELRKIAGGGLGDHIMRSTPEGATYFDFS